MSKSPPRKEKRDENLDALLQAVNEYASKEIKRIDNEVVFLRDVLKKRGIGNAAAENLNKSVVAAMYSINAFLTGE